MTQAHHTQGEWKVEGNLEEGLYIIDESESEICQVFCIDGDAESEANARLIAAAPKLLEAAEAGGRYSDALKEMQDNGKFGVTVTGEKLDRLFRDWHDKTHAAIAAAEGE